MFCYDFLEHHPPQVSLSTPGIAIPLACLFQTARLLFASFISLFLPSRMLHGIFSQLPHEITAFIRFQLNFFVFPIPSCYVSFIVSGRICLCFCSLSFRHQTITPKVWISQPWENEYARKTTTIRVRFYELVFYTQWKCICSLMCRYLNECSTNMSDACEADQQQKNT